MVKCESLRINMFRITHTGKSVNFPVTLSSFTFSVSVITQIIYKSHSIAKFQMNSRRGDNSSLFDDLTLCASFMEMIAIHFQVPKRLFFLFLFCTNPAQSLHLVTVCHPFYLYFTEDFTSFLEIAICIYLCFAEKVLFRFLALVSSVIRLEYQTRPVSCAKG